VSSSSHGSQAHTFGSGHETQTRKYNENANTSPARSAPAKRIPSARPSRYVPNAATKTFSRQTIPSDHQKGRTYAGRLNGESTADWAFAKKGRPPPT
jgi:hypothetical protein